MAASPAFKVYDSSGEYVAATKDPVHAGVLVDFLGAGATLRFGHRVVLWTEGSEAQPAGESWDFVDRTVAERLAKRPGRVVPKTAPSA